MVCTVLSQISNPPISNSLTCSLSLSLSLALFFSRSHPHLTQSVLWHTERQTNRQTLTHTLKCTLWTQILNILNTTTQNKTHKHHITTYPGSGSEEDRTGVWVLPTLLPQVAKQLGGSPPYWRSVWQNLLELLAHTHTHTHTHADTDRHRRTDADTCTQTDTDTHNDVRC